MSRLTVQLADNSYEIQIEGGLLSEIGTRCGALGLGKRAAVVTNPTVGALYGEQVASALGQAGFSVVMVAIPDGEQFKNAATLNSVYDALIDGGLDRKSFIVALGGGVVGDLAGYAAATYLRGIPFVQVPTTLLAQVDSSVGGKTAIDHPRGKNLIGAFYQPRLVLVDVNTLMTLPERQFKAGLAEVIKYGVALDAGFFNFLEEHRPAVSGRDPQVLREIIHRSCAIKAAIVEQDEKESGVRAVLNYGHTLGHALEALAGYRDLVHGEAVALGMILAARVSARLGYCAAEDVDRVTALVRAFGLNTTLPAVERQPLLEAVMTDKKSRDGSISFICNRGIGNFAVHQLQPEELLTLSGLEV